MNEIEIIFCRGIPGSGKTVWAKDWVLKDTTKRIRINNDDLKQMMQPLELPFNQILGPIFSKARLTIIKEYSLKNIIPRKDLLMAINCIDVDCEVIGKCPLCGKDVIKGKYNYGCIGYKDGCNFKISTMIQSTRKIIP